MWHVALMLCVVANAEGVSMVGSSVAAAVSEAAVEAVLAAFTTPTAVVPPMFSPFFFTGILVK